MPNRSIFFAAVSLCLIPGNALAQRADDNAVRQAEDGFGSTVGNDSIGLYNVGSARGFSPYDAGNVRMNGLYFDARGDLPDVMLSGSMVRVGITALRTPLLAPSGIAEFSLKEIGERPVTSVGLYYGDYGSSAIETETRIGRRAGLSLVAAGRVDIDSHYHDGASDHGWSYALVPRWQIGSDAVVQAYLGQSRFSGFEDGPTYYTAGDFTPPHIPRRQAVQQAWNRNGGLSTQFGLLADIGLGDGWRARGGLFRARIAIEPGVYEYVDAVTQQGTGIRNAILSPRFDAQSWSGEARLSKTWRSGDIEAELSAGARFRFVEEHYGAGEGFTLDATPVPLARYLPATRPTLNFPARDTNHVRQFQPGLALQIGWQKVAMLNLGVQKADYRKHARLGSGEMASGSSHPVLWNAGLAIMRSDTLTLYGGLSRGLEESGVAPTIASNASEALPAAITRQKDIALHWRPHDRLSLILGAFLIERPYANLDPANRYRFLGTLKNRGVEASLVAKPAKGLSIVIGALRQWPRLSGEEVALGITGSKPVAFADYEANAAIDYEFGALPGLSMNAGVTAYGPQMARADGSLGVAARQRVDAGVRYRFHMRGGDWSLSANVSNVFDSYGWNVSGDGGFTYSSPRAFSVSLLGDF